VEDALTPEARAHRRRSECGGRQGRTRKYCTERKKGVRKVAGEAANVIRGVRLLHRKEKDGTGGKGGEETEVDHCSQRFATRVAKKCTGVWEGGKKGILLTAKGKEGGRDRRGNRKKEKCFAVVIGGPVLNPLLHKALWCKGKREGGRAHHEKKSLSFFKMARHSFLREVGAAEGEGEKKGSERVSSIDKWVTLAKRGRPFRKGA